MGIGTGRWREQSRWSAAAPAIATRARSDPPPPWPPSRPAFEPAPA